MKERDIIYVIAMNTWEIYKDIEWLANCIRKRIARGESIQVEHLAQCSTMRKITLNAKRLEEKYGGRITKEEREYGAHLIAERVIEMAEEV